MTQSISQQTQQTQQPQSTEQQIQTHIDACLKLVTDALDDVKAKNITVLDVTNLTDVADRMVIAEGTSKRHVQALADHVSVTAKQAGYLPLGREGEKESDWTLVDLGSVVVHVMMPQAREFYDLEGLWSSPEQLAQLTQPVHDKRSYENR